MHFIQNSWFAVYSIWLVLLTLGVVGIIAHIHNRRRYLRRIAVYFSVTFVLAITFSFQTDRSIFINSDQLSISKPNNGQQVENPSLLNSAFRFIGSVLRDKISN